MNTPRPIRTSVERPTSVTMEVQPAPGRARASILLVDDHPPNLVALEAILAPLGEHLVKASSGQEALLRLLERDYAVVLMDVQMPEIDGLQTASLMRQRARSRETPIVFLTATSRERSNVFAGYQHGAVDYLLKPIDAEILQSKVRVFVELFRLRDKIRTQEAELRRHERQAFEREHEVRVRAFSDALPQALWAGDATGNIYYCNRVWFDYSGYNLARSLNAGLFDAVHPGDRERVIAAWHATVRTHAPFEMRFRLRRIDGAYRWHLGRAANECDDRGLTIGWIATATDIDESYRAEQSRALLEDVTAALMTSMDPRQLSGLLAERMVPHGADWCVVSTSNRAGETAVVAHHVDPSKRGALNEMYVKFAAVTASESAAAAMDSANPELLTALGTISSIVVPLVRRGRTFGAMIVGMSESDRVYEDSDVPFLEEIAGRLCTALEHAMLFHAANESNRLKDEFVATVSHELRTPLNAILGWTRMLRNGMLVAEKRERALETIERNANAQVQLVEDLLDVSRIITGKLRLNLQPVDARVVIEAAVLAVRPGADDKRVRLETALDDTTATIEADPDRLQQVVWNLINNAIKFTPPGGLVEVKLRWPDSSGIEITVQDDGQGIAPDFLPAVFDRFRQAESGSGSGRATAGLGLGLSLVKHIVDLHGGAVSAASEGEGRGSTFVITLPATHRATLPG